MVIGVTGIRITQLVGAVWNLEVGSADIFFCKGPDFSMRDRGFLALWTIQSLSEFFLHNELTAVVR